MINDEVARIFYEIADVLELKDVEWKPRAYRKAAQAIESLEKDLVEIYKNDGTKGLMEIPGVGEALAKKIVEYIETKKIKGYERLKSSLPKGLFELMNVMGLGPSRIKVLYKKLNVKGLKDLERAIKKHKISHLEGFGLKSEENIQKAIELKKIKEVNKINIGGSLRRMQETIGDIDFLVTSSSRKKIMDAFTELPDVSRVLAKGETKTMVILKQGIQSDIRVLEDKNYAAAL